MTGRYAIYFTPDDSSELGLFDATVLRRRSEDAGDWLNPELPVDFPQSSDWAERIKKPAHYGFHATMKAPFELAPGQSADQLLAEVAEFSHKQTPIDLTGLAPVRSCRYDSLAFDQQPEAIPQLASECVTRFEQFRAPLTEADVQRRDPDSLTESQRQNMYQYGYPHVLNDFNFHMTLSGQNDHRDPAYFNWLMSVYQSMVKVSPVLDRLCVFHQPDRNTSFLRIAEYLFQ